MSSKNKSNKKETPVLNPETPAPAATPAPETEAKAPAKPEELVLTALTFAQICELDAGQQDGLMKGFSKSVKRLKDAKDENKQESKSAAILLAAVEQRVKRGIEARIYPSTKTSSDVYKDVTGEKPPGHVWTLKEAFVNFVPTGFITESDFVANRNNCLEIAQRIVNACIEHHETEGLQHSAVSLAAVELKNRSDKEAKNLRAILDSVKPVEVMTAETALELFQQIASSPHLCMILAQLPDAIVAQKDGEQKNCYVALFKSIERTESALGETAAKWADEQANAEAPVKIITAETAPVETAPADLATA